MALKGFLDDPLQEEVNDKEKLKSYLRSALHILDDDELVAAKTGLSISMELVRAEAVPRREGSYPRATLQPQGLVESVPPNQSSAGTD